MDLKDRRLNIININDMNELRSVILNEIETQENLHHSRSQKNQFIPRNKTVHPEELHKFIISMYTTFSKNIRDYKILSFFLLQIKSIYDIIKYSDNKNSIVYDISTKLDYEYIESNKIIFRKGIYSFH
jgi:hypothetical protein